MEARLLGAHRSRRRASTSRTTRSITRQDQAQIYQELVSAPPDVRGAQTAASARKPAGQLTTSFLSICAKVKDNRLLPHGFLKLEDRIEIADALGADAELAHEAGPAAVGDDPDYRTGGGDSLAYRVPLAELAGKPAAVQATLYYQATPPILPAGPLLHLEEQGHQAALLI